ncbi:hypothetical protein OsccyDRAFT_5072 [Leptolyngbyaceae cyanobacterium JSC-12]|nr:hypothetical protein OsccyDRAFT_5072 [Leptolyngbyaceae cyanobacterium JSC-12]
MTGLRLPRRVLSIIILGVLGFAIALSLPVASNPINPAPEPTSEMITFFENRTREHINRVHHNLTILAKLPTYPQDILSRGEIHDASKFVQPERVPYIWLTEFYRRRQSGEVFTYPNGVEEQVKAAIHHHVTTNRHHPEFHASPNDMSDVDLIEMVCDWTAIAQELEENGVERNGGSARSWADRTIGKREGFNFSEAKKEFIYQVIDDLDRQRTISSLER